MLYNKKNEKHMILNSVPQSQYVAEWFLISMCCMKDFHWEIQHTCQLTPKPWEVQHTCRVTPKESYNQQPKIITGAKSNLANK